jgi:flagellar motor switch protein FliM
LSRTHGRLAKTIARSAETWLGIPCEVHHREVTEEPVARLLDEAGSHVVLFPLASGSGAVLFHVAGSLVQGLVDRLLGGPGESRGVDRPPTAIERALLAPLTDAVRAALGTCGGTQPKAGSPLEAEAREPHRASLGVIARFDLEIGSCVGPFHIFYPYEAVQEVLGIAVGAGSTGANAEPEEKLTPEHLGSVRVRVRAFLEPAPVPLRDLTSLRIGDVLRLDRKLTDEVVVRVGDREVFTGYPGAVDGRVGVRIRRTGRTTRSVQR